MRRMSANQKLLTAEDVLAPEYERGELWDGAFVVREPSGGWAGVVEGRAAWLLGRSEAWQRGWTFGASQGYVVGRDPDRVLAPDLSFCSRERLSAPPKRGFIEGPPDFAVEVRSPSDSWISTIEKGGVWIGHGVRVVWCIDPAARLVVVMRPGQAPLELGPGDVAGARPALDAEIELARLFEGLRQ